VDEKTDGAVFTVSSTHQAVKRLARSVDVTQLGASECHTTDIMMGMKRTSIDIGVPLRPEFDLNEGPTMDEANQDDSAIYANASASLTTTSGGLATKGHFHQGSDLIQPGGVDIQFQSHDFSNKFLNFLLQVSRVTFC